MGGFSIKSLLKSTWGNITVFLKKLILLTPFIIYPPKGVCESRTQRSPFEYLMFYPLGSRKGTWNSNFRSWNYINICYTIPFIKFLEKKCESQGDEVGRGLDLGSSILPRRNSTFSFFWVGSLFLTCFLRNNAQKT